uniref:Uncharacterized protein n=1 Tax=Zea mays TaxID=4577 RepID=A0A804UJ60_MAIZE
MARQCMVFGVRRGRTPPRAPSRCQPLTSVARDVVRPPPRTGVAELKERLAKMYKVKDPNTIFVFKFRTSSTGSGLIYDNLYSKKFEPKYCLMRRKFAQWRKRFKSMDLHPTKPWLFTLFVQKESVLDREDAYLAQVVFEHMQLDDNEVVLGGGQDAMNVTMIDCRVGKFEAKFYHKARAMTPESEVKCHATVFSGWFTERPSRCFPLG